MVRAIPPQLPAPAKETIARIRTVILMPTVMVLVIVSVMIAAAVLVALPTLSLRKFLHSDKQRIHL